MNKKVFVNCLTLAAERNGEMKTAADVMLPKYNSSNIFFIMADLLIKHAHYHTAFQISILKEEHTVEMDFSLEIVQPVIETEEEETELTEEPAFQWWVVILVGFAIIAVIVAVIVVTKVTRAAKLK